MTLKITSWIIFGFALIFSVSACTSNASPLEGRTPPAPTVTPQASSTWTASPPPTLSPSHTPRPEGEQIPSPETPQTTPTPHHCWNKGGYLSREEILTTELEHPLEFGVYLPPCYYHQVDRYFPVLYLLHGLYSTDVQWVRMGVVDTANDLMAKGEIPSFIIILPRDQDWSLPPDNKFGEMIISELVPWVDGNYRTIPGHEFRAIGGLSRGGNWAINIGLQHWGMFGAFGAHSAPVFYSDGLQIPRWLNDIPDERIPRIFLDIGESDGNGAYIYKFENMLSERNIPHEWHLNPGTHNEEYWSAHLGQYLRWYSEAWQEG